VEKFVVYCNGVGGVAMLFSVIFSTVNIVMRTFHLSIPGSVEIVSNTNVVIAWLGFGYCAFKDKHIKIEVTNKWPLLDRIYNIIVIIGLCVFGVQCIIQGITAYNLRTTTPILHFIKYPFYYVTALGFFSMMIAVICNECKFYAKKWKSKDVKHGKGVVKFES
jgi:TRAP-type C4-dicarboxylate transport system permease small subunit